MKHANYCRSVFDLKEGFPLSSNNFNICLATKIVMQQKESLRRWYRFRKVWLVFGRVHSSFVPNFRGRPALTSYPRMTSQVDSWILGGLHLLQLFPVPWAWAGAFPKHGKSALVLFTTWPQVSATCWPHDLCFFWSQGSPVHSLHLIVLGIQGHLPLDRWEPSQEVAEGCHLRLAKPPWKQGEIMEMEDKQGLLYGKIIIWGYEF